MTERMAADAIPESSLLSCYSDVVLLDCVLVVWSPVIGLAKAGLRCWV
jgi:hypothetical protein